MRGNVECGKFRGEPSRSLVMLWGCGWEAKLYTTKTRAATLGDTGKKCFSSSPPAGQVGLYRERGGGL